MINAAPEMFSADKLIYLWVPAISSKLDLFNEAIGAFPIITNAVLGDHLSSGTFFSCELEAGVFAIWVLSKADETVMRIIKCEEHNNRKQE